MCKAPKPPKPKDPEKPEFLRNPYLDAEMGGRGLVSQMRQGRSSLRIPLSNSQSASPATAAPTGIAPPPRAASTLNSSNAGLAGIRGRNTESFNRSLRFR